MEKENTWENFQKTIYSMVSIGVTDNRLNQSYDIISTLALVVNLVGAFASTFEEIRAAHGPLLHWVETITVAIFAVDYVLRLLCAGQHYRGCSDAKAALKYATSGYGIIDLLSFLPHYLPAFFPAGAAVFRMFRVVRIFRLFRINAYSDSLTLIGNVLKNKRTQILASVFIVVMLILASSLCMYSVEHNAQPEVFRNGFSAIWWATSTLLTVGYGDIYPITFLGQLLGIVITFLGVGLVAIPTGIISAGFIEEYQKATRFADIEQEKDVRFIEASIDEGDVWAGKTISEIAMPSGSIIALVIRDKETIVPRGDVRILLGDKLIICAESATEGMLEDVKEIVLRSNHSWNGQKIRELDISRQTYIVMVDRDGKMLKPDPELVLEEGDRIIVFSKESINKYMRAYSI